jgi:hypothetical protein
LKNSIKVGGATQFNITGNILGASKISTGTSSIFKAANITGTIFNDSLSFGKASLNNITSIDVAAGNDKLSLATNSKTNISTIAFGEGNDTLSLAKNAELSIMGGKISGLEVIKGNASNSIYLYNGATIDNMVNIKSIEKVNVVEVIDYVKSTAANSWNTEVLNKANNVDRFNLTGKEKFQIANLDNVSVSYLKDGVWSELIEGDTIKNAAMVSVSLKVIDKKSTEDLKYSYSITSL